YSFAMAFIPRILASSSANSASLTKSVLLSEAELAELEAKIRGMNAMAKLYRTQDAAVEMDAVLGVKAFDLTRALEIDPDFLGEDAHEHDETVGSIALVESGEINGQKLNDWLSTLLQTQGPDIFRMKGILNIQGEDQRFVFQGVHMLFDGRPDRQWKPEETRKNELVFIGRNLDAAQLKEDFRACLV
ncbi:MAG: GTP-binding protein, partial [Cyanobacteria bacterium J06607_13]